jgi:hypothetical protein
MQIIEIVQPRAIITFGKLPFDFIHQEFEGLLWKWNKRGMEAAAQPIPNPNEPSAQNPLPSTGAQNEPISLPPKKRLPTRFHGSITLDSARVGRDAGRIADEVVSHLSGLVGSNVRVVIEIDASVPGGVADEIVRIVTENARTLKFESHGFESE